MKKLKRKIKKWINFEKIKKKRFAGEINKIKNNEEF